MAKELMLWHGGRNLEDSYRESIAPKGRWDHGPGLYLTSSYSRASQYSKGGGSTYKVVVEEGNYASNVRIPIENVFDFVNSSIIGKKKKIVLEYVHNNMKRLNDTGNICAETFLNIVLNEEAISKSKANKLCDFMVENKADFIFVSRYGGNEDVLVVLNRSKIKSVNKVKSKDVSIDDYDLTISFNENSSTNKTIKIN